MLEIDADGRPAPPPDAEIEPSPIPPGAFRRVKAGFIVLSLLAISGITGLYLHRRLVVEPRLVEASFEELFLAKEGGGRLARPVEAPPFEIETADGKRFSPSAVAGQVLFVNFWATWCPPCREEMPSMLALGAELARAHPGKFTMVAVSIDDGWGPIREYFASGMPAGVVVGLDEDQKATHAYYCAARGVCPDTYQVPESYIVDKRGRLLAFVVNRRDWSEPAARKFLERLIEE